MRGGQRNFRGKVSTLHIGKTSITVDFNKLHIFLMQYFKCESESRSVVSNCLQAHGLYSPWNSPGQNTAVGSLSSRDLPNPRTKPSSLALQVEFFTSWATKEAKEYWSGWPISPPVDLPDSGIEPESPRDSLKIHKWKNPSLQSCRMVSIWPSSILPKYEHVIVF